MPHNKELRVQPARELRVQTSPDGSRTISGYAAVYNSDSVGLPWTERVAPGAFRDALSGTADVICLRDHRQELLMGRTLANTLTLTDDAVGLRFVCRLPPTSQAADLAESISRKDLDGVSFGFSVPNGGDSWSKDGQGKLTRTLNKVTLYEISPCSFPAYPSTSVSVRTCPPELRSFMQSRSEDDGECECDCPECMLGDCADCSNPDCESEHCIHGENSVRSMDLWQLSMRLAIATRL